jgi:7-cyano-7-deazaguanine reductase
VSERRAGAGYRASLADEELAGVTISADLSPQRVLEIPTESLPGREFESTVEEAESVPREHQSVGVDIEDVSLPDLDLRVFHAKGSSPSLDDIASQITEHDPCLEIHDHLLRLPGIQRVQDCEKDRGTPSTRSARKSLASDRFHGARSMADHEFEEGTSLNPSDYEGLQEDVRSWKLPAIETWSNLYADRDYEIRIEIPEFNCICPKTGLPDFATLTIDYVPDRDCVELKSLKLYVTNFRNLGIFHELAVNRILDDFVRAVRPRRARLEGVFNARGGIATTVRAAWPSIDAPSLHDARSQSRETRTLSQ